MKYTKYESFDGVTDMENLVMAVPNQQFRQRKNSDNTTSDINLMFRNQIKQK